MFIRQCLLLLGLLLLVALNAKSASEIKQKPVKFTASLLR